MYQSTVHLKRKGYPGCTHKYVSIRMRQKVKKKPLIITIYIILFHKQLSSFIHQYL